MHACKPFSTDACDPPDAMPPQSGVAMAMRRDTCARIDARCCFIQHVVAQAFGVGIDALRATTRRQAPVAFARQLAMYLAHVCCSLTLTEVGHFFGRDRTTVAHACQVIENRRDMPSTGLAVDCLEAALVEWFSHHSRNDRDRFHRKGGSAHAHGE